MALTPEQLAALKADILADPVLAAKPNNGDGNLDVAAAYNLAAAPAFYVWDRAASVAAILNGLNYANFTPNDAPNQATEVAGQTWENRAMLVQIKQINLQMMLQGRESFDATRVNNRTGLQDATENVPTGNNGNNRTGGWPNILPVLSRACTRAEKLFATGTGTQAVPAVAAFEGQVSPQDVETARNLPG
jgi:hypothetical protein